MCIFVFVFVFVLKSVCWLSHESHSSEFFSVSSTHSMIIYMDLHFKISRPAFSYITSLCYDCMPLYTLTVEILGSHGDEHEDGCLLGCCTA
jgi:hypothetical protein